MQLCPLSWGTRGSFPRRHDPPLGGLQLFDDVTSPLAVLSRTGVPISSTGVFSFFVKEPAPTMSTHDPRSMSHHRDSVGTSSHSEDSDECVTIGVSGVVAETALGAIWSPSSFPFSARTKVITRVNCHPSLVGGHPSHWFRDGSSSFSVRIWTLSIFDIDLNHPGFFFEKHLLRWNVGSRPTPDDLDLVIRLFCRWFHFLFLATGLRPRGVLLESRPTPTTS